MKKIFALAIAGSFLFVGCGGNPMVDYAEKSCECTKTAKDDPAKGAECLKGLADLQKEAMKAAADDPEGAAEAAKISAKCAAEVMQ